MYDSWTSVINLLLYSNGRLWFHSFIDATGKSQDTKFLLKGIKKVVADMEENNIISIITDNGSNYKKDCRCLTNEYQHIAWQPCLVHAINLMLKIIGNFLDHESIIDSTKLIARWLYATPSF
jgi:hypothetical protein